MESCRFFKVKCLCKYISRRYPGNNQLLIWLLISLVATLLDRLPEVIQRQREIEKRNPRGNGWKNHYRRFLWFSVLRIFVLLRNYNKGERNPKEWREIRDERREDLEFFARRSASISHINRGQVDAIALLSQSMDFTDAGIQ